MRTSICLFALLLLSTVPVQTQTKFSWDDVQRITDQHFLHPNSPTSPLDVPGQFDEVTVRWVANQARSNRAENYASTYCVADITSDGASDVVLLYRWRKGSKEQYHLALFENVGDNQRFQFRSSTPISKVHLNFQAITSIVPGSMLLLKDATSSAKKLYSYRSDGFVEERAADKIDAVIAATPVAEEWCKLELPRAISRDESDEESSEILAIYDLHPLDVDNDNDIDVVASCITSPEGGNTFSSYLALFRNTGGQFEYSSYIKLGDRGERTFANAANVITMKGKTLVVKSAYWKKDDGMCCPSGETAARFTLARGVLVETN